MGFFDDMNPETNPDLVELRYRLGRSPFFEVNLVLDEFSANVGDAVRTVPAFIAINQPSGGIISGGGGNNGECPRVDQWLWSMKGTTLVPIRAEMLLEGDFLHNPLTGEAQRVVVAEIVKKQPILHLVTNQGGELFASQTHPIIRYRTDGRGTPAKDLKKGNSALSWVKQVLIDDMMAEIEKAEKADAVKITLEKGYIYAAGTTPETCIVGHNLKRSPL